MWIYLVVSAENARERDLPTLPLSLHLSRQAACDACDQENRRRRVSVNPFACGRDIGEWTTLGPHQLYDWVLDLGLPPLPAIDASRDDMIFWWLDHAPQMTAHQFDKMWEACNLVRFAVVEEVEFAHFTTP